MAARTVPEPEPEQMCRSNISTVRMMNWGQRVAEDPRQIHTTDGDSRYPAPSLKKLVTLPWPVGTCLGLPPG